jgi:hypothetical protein
MPDPEEEDAFVQKFKVRQQEKEFERELESDDEGNQ